MAGCGGRASVRSSERRVAVIGGGLAGLVCAYRLQQAGQRVHLFEAQNRLGGRMRSHALAGGRVAELGGEFIDTGHKHMHGLARELGIALDDRQALTRGLAEETRFFFDGQRVSEEALAGWLAPIAKPLGDEVQRIKTDRQAFLLADKESISELLARLHADRRLIDVVDAGYTAFYGRSIAEQSALNLLTLFDPVTRSIYGESDERFHAHGGSEQFIRALANKLEKDTAIELGCALESVRESAGGYQLTLRREGGGSFARVYDHVVLAIPFTVLRSVELQVAALPPIQRSAIAELGYGTNAKLIVQTNGRPWAEVHGAAGYTLTDNGLQVLWDSSIGQPAGPGILTNFMGGQRGVDLAEGTADARGREMMGLVEPIYPGTARAYRPDETLRATWFDRPWALGSYTCCRPGEWRLALAAGARAGNLHFCGEHTSFSNQGYMEGAAESGARVALEILSG